MLIIRKLSFFILIFKWYLSCFIKRWNHLLRIWWTVIVTELKMESLIQNYFFIYLIFRGILTSSKDVNLSLFVIGNEGQTDKSNISTLIIWQQYCIYCILWSIFFYFIGQLTKCTYTSDVYKKNINQYL